MIDTCLLDTANTTHTTCNLSSSSLCVCTPHNYTVVIHISSSDDTNKVQMDSLDHTQI